MGYETYEKQVPGRGEKENVGKAEDAHYGDGSEAFVRHHIETVPQDISKWLPAFSPGITRWNLTHEHKPKCMARGKEHL